MSTRFSGVLKKTRAVQTGGSESPAPVPKRIGRPPGKKSDPNYQQVTVYIRKEIHVGAKKHLLDDGKEFSELVDELVAKWVTSRRSDG